VSDHDGRARVQGGQESGGVVDVVHQVESPERNRRCASMEAPAVIKDAAAVQGKFLGGIRP
jgi:hypothetical protein